jgi:hypothetical protein
MSTHGIVREIELPRVQDPRGDLTFVEGNNHVPFDIPQCQDRCRTLDTLFL